MILQKAIIVDDEYLARVNLTRLLDVYEDIRIVGEADSCEVAAKLISEEKPDLLFLDIQLVGETGFDLLPMIQVEPFPSIVFVTAYDEYAVRAFEVNALDYLLKPINPERLKQTIHRVRNRDDGCVYSGKFSYTDSIFLKTSNNISRFVDIAAILSITSVGNHSEITLNDGSKVIILKTLKLWEEDLPSEYFLRIHKSTIINRQYVDKVERTSNSEHLLYLKSILSPFPVSRRRMREFRKDKLI